MANFQPPGPELFLSETFSRGGQTFHENPGIVAAGPEGPLVLDQGLEVEVKDREVLDALWDLVDDEVAVLRQDADRVVVDEFRDDLVRVLVAGRLNDLPLQDEFDDLFSAEVREGSVTLA